VKPASRKQAARYMVQSHQLSERAACRLMDISRTGYRYTAKPRDAVWKGRKVACLVGLSKQLGWQSIAIYNCHMARRVLAFC